MQVPIWYLSALLSLVPAFSAWPVSQLRTNVWATLANETGQGTLCLDTATPDNPFSTCLVALLIDGWPKPRTVSKLLQSRNHAHSWDQWVAYLPRATPEPQEIELLGPVKTDLCVKFNSSRSDQSKGQDFSPNQPVFANESACCNSSSAHISHSTAVPLALPPGVFFIGRHRARAVIPSHIKGGPCSLRQSSLLTPKTHL